MSYWTRGSQAGFYSKNTWGAFKNPVVHAVPRLIKLESLDPGIRIFKNLQLIPTCSWV